MSGPYNPIIIDGLSDKDVVKISTFLDDLERVILDATRVERTTQRGIVNALALIGTTGTIEDKGPEARAPSSFSFRDEPDVRSRQYEFAKLLRYCATYSITPERFAQICKERGMEDLHFATFFQGREIGTKNPATPVKLYHAAASYEPRAKRGKGQSKRKHNGIKLRR